MPNGKPDPGCKDCKGTGQITMFTSSSECDCVNRESTFGGKTDKITDLDSNPYTKYFQKEFTIESIPFPKIPNRVQVDPDWLKKTIEHLHMSADYIADGIVTWYMWPGIKGHTCNGCGAEMNVLGMSYNHWCPLCDPDGKKHVYPTMSRCGRMPFDYPVFSPSIDTIREGGRRADIRRKEHDRGSIRDTDGACDGKTG